jgi:hypothetical protein
VQSAVVNDIGSKFTPVPHISMAVSECEEENLLSERPTSASYNDSLIQDFSYQESRVDVGEDISFVPF